MFYQISVLPGGDFAVRGSEYCCGGTFRGQTDIINIFPEFGFCAFQVAVAVVSGDMALLPDQFGQVWIFFGIATVKKKIEP